ncbi:MAG: hypothetical protein A3H44_01400 [Gammaproteobacteria bacterium RIFCSPLOWO2_02_FULL_57_10]|nr:MAG: hypothetical protein A3H44_01400 [Gammaproteobacteria bacterium RIFCSPLOWO2_02_FULL_57_10]
MMSVQVPAMADIVSTEQLAFEQQTQIKRDAVKSFFSRDDVAAQLVERGVDVADAQQRVDSLSGSELNALYEQIDTLPAGEGLGIVIGILVIFILLDVAGVTDIFPAI